MKIKPEHYAQLVQDLKASAGTLPSFGYFREVVARERVGADAEKFYRWELFSAAYHGTRDVVKHDFHCELYKYLNDSNIDAALKKAVKEI